MTPIWTPFEISTLWIHIGFGRNCNATPIVTHINPINFGRFPCAQLTGYRFGWASVIGTSNVVTENRENETWTYHNKSLKSTFKLIAETLLKLTRFVIHRKTWHYVNLSRNHNKLYTYLESFFHFKYIT